MADILVKQASVSQSTAVRLGWRTPAAVLASTGLVALCAHVALPLSFTPIPATMQTFAVLLIGLLLSPGAAFASLALYLAEGAAGLPVFSPHGPGGVAQLLGPTGGYLLSYPFAAAIASYLYRFPRRGISAAVAGAAVASIFILILGATWLGIVSRAPFLIVVSQSIAPFLLGDAIKVVAAAACARVFDKFGGDKFHGQSLKGQS
jgi:biotin transport system substrate-specific component